MSAPTISRWVAIGGFLVFGVLSGVSFLYGAKPVMQLERGGLPLHIPDIGHRCPELVPSERGYDDVCARHLIERGPLVLGEAAFAVSFACGLAALGALSLHRGVARVTAVVLLVLYLCGWALLLVWNAREGQRLVEAATA
jgi:hypothetical protein